MRDECGGQGGAELHTRHSLHQVIMPFALHSPPCGVGVGLGVGGLSLCVVMIVWVLELVNTSLDLVKDSGYSIYMEVCLHQPTFRQTNHQDWHGCAHNSCGVVGVCVGGGWVSIQGWVPKFLCDSPLSNISPQSLYDFGAEIPASIWVFNYYPSLSDSPRKDPD